MLLGGCNKALKYLRVRPGTLGSLSTGRWGVISLQSKPGSRVLPRALLAPGLLQEAKGKARGRGDQRVSPNQDLSFTLGRSGKRLHLPLLHGIL